MSQPIDRVYVDIVPRLKGFDKSLARKVKKQTEDMFKGVSTSGTGSGSRSSVRAPGIGGLFPLGGTTADPRQFRLQQGMFAAMRKAERDRQRVLDELHRKAIAEDRRRLQEMNNLHAEALRMDRERTKRIDADRNLRDNRRSAIRDSLLKGPGPIQTLSTLGNITENIGSLFRVGLIAAMVTFGAAFSSVVAGFALTLPVAIGTTGLAVGALLLGTRGLKDAFEALGASTEDFEAAIEGLTPSAQNFMREVRRVYPELKKIQQLAQEGLFRGFEGEIEKTVNALSGPLQTGFFSLGQSFQHLAMGFTEWVRSTEGVSAVNQLFDTTNQLIRQWKEPLDSAYEAFARLTDSASPFLLAVNEKITGALDKVSKKIIEMDKDGRLDKFFDQAIEDLQLMSDLLKDIAKTAKSLVGSFAPTARNIMQGWSSSLAADRAVAALPGGGWERPAAGTQARIDWDKAIDAEGLRRHLESIETGKAPQDSWLLRMLGLDAEQDIKKVVDRLQREAAQSQTEAQRAASEEQKSWARLTGEAVRKDWDTLWRGTVTATVESAKIIWDGLKTGWNATSTFLSEAWNTFWRGTVTATVETTKAIWNGLKTGWNATWAFLTQTLPAWLAGIRARINEWVNGVVGAWSSAGSRMINALVAGVLSGMSAFAGAVNRMIQIANRIPTINIPYVTPPGWHAPMLPPGVRMAHGGIVTGPTAALVGEAGDEMVFPLNGSQGRSAMNELAQAMQNAGVPGAQGSIIIENHIEIGGEVVRVVRSEINVHDRDLVRRARSGSQTRRVSFA